MLLEDILEMRTQEDWNFIREAELFRPSLRTCILINTYGERNYSGRFINVKLRNKMALLIIKDISTTNTNNGTIATGT